MEYWPPSRLAAPPGTTEMALAISSIAALYRPRSIKLTPARKKRSASLIFISRCRSSVFAASMSPPVCRGGFKSHQGNFWLFEKLIHTIYLYVDRMLCKRPECLLCNGNKEECLCRCIVNIQASCNTSCQYINVSCVSIFESKFTYSS